MSFEAAYVTATRPRQNPVLGSLREYRRDILLFLKQCAERHGDLVPIRVVFHRGFLVSSPDLAAEVLTRRAHDYRKIFPLRLNRLFLGAGLLTSEGEQWLTDRRMIQPAFHADRVGAYGTTIVEQALVTRDAWSAGRVVDIQQDMAELTLRAVVRCLFDVRDALDTDRISAAMNVVQQRMRERYRALIPLPDTAWTLQNVAYRRALNTLDEIVYGFIRQRRGDGGGRADLLSMLVAARREDGSALTDRQLRDQVMAMFFAGHETTALALSWSLYLLARHPRIDELLFEELSRVLAGRAPTSADYPHLRLTTQVVQESMRLYPPVYAFGRDAIRETEIAGRTIPARSSVVISPWVIHRDPRFYTNPNVFDPHRWADGFERTLPKYAYCPFGGGARMCLGRGFSMLEAVLVLATLLSRYRFEPAPEAAIELWPAFTLRSRTGVHLRPQRRESRVIPVRTDSRQDNGSRTERS
jgi:cytochrome P450